MQLTMRKSLIGQTCYGQMIALLKTLIRKSRAGLVLIPLSKKFLVNHFGIDIGKQSQMNNKALSARQC